MQNNKDSFLDSKNLLAIGLVVAVFVGWQSYLTKKYPAQPSNGSASVGAKAESSKTAMESKQTALETHSEPGPVSTQSSEPETLTAVRGENLSFSISSRGMGLKDIHVNKFTDKQNKIVTMDLDSNRGLFESSVAGVGEVNFSVEKISETEYRGTAKTQAGSITKTININQTNYSVSEKIVVENAGALFKGIDVFLPQKKSEAKKSGFLNPATDVQEFVVQGADKAERINVSSAKEDIEKTFSLGSLVGVGTQYFTSAILDKSNLRPQVTALYKQGTSSALATLSYRPMDLSQKFEINFVGFVGPKSLTLLESVDKDFAPLIDYGFFSPIAKILLSLLRWFQGFVSNWGLSIILLTLLVRFLVMPFALMSMKSMKAMQKIQPLVKQLQEKYKDEPQVMQRELMGLYKTHKVNPVGGCLPMLLQFPVFIALYQVLGKSIELYHAPFFGWITDLSSKDPFYILPVLMGVSMFFQQKLTPTATMDPAQAKILQFMPVLFSFMMLSLPSGLTLYIFVSTMFGIFQQMLFLRQAN